MSDLIQATHYLPILTTIISAVFSWKILTRYCSKPGAKHLLWWGIGVAVYGIGTLTEALITLFGWQEVLFKAWYISGALLGGAPLALGTVFLLLGRKAGSISAVLLAVVVFITSIFVIMSPIDYTLVDRHLPNGRVLVWQSIRLVSPLVNTFAAIFLIGGAIYSAVLYFRTPLTRNRSIGNIYIAVGAILPGIGGFLSRVGYTQALYVGEFIGIILIWFGYLYCQRPIIQPVSQASQVSTVSK